MAAEPHRDEGRHDIHRGDMHDHVAGERPELNERQDDGAGRCDGKRAYERAQPAAVGRNIEGAGCFHPCPWISDDEVAPQL